MKKELINRKHFNNDIGELFKDDIISTDVKKNYIDYSDENLIKDFSIDEKNIKIRARNDLAC